MSATYPIAIGMAIFLAPQLSVFAYKRWQRQKESAYRELSFEPGVESPAGTMLRRFTAPQRVYLTQQLKLSVGVYLFLSWLFLFLLSLPFFGHAPTARLWSNPSAFFWFRFLGDEVSSTHLFGSMLIFAAFIVIIPLRIGGEARYYRTRPLSIGFLFWVRFLLVSVALVAAIATSVAILYALLLALKGPIWQHLPPAIPRTLGPDDAGIAQDYLNLLVTSVPHLLLSAFTSSLMLVCAMVAIITIPFKRPIAAGRFPVMLVPLFFAAVVGPVLWRLLNTFQSIHLPRVLFIYDYLGPPPPSMFALVPIVLSVAFIALARYFVTWLEV